MQVAYSKKTCLNIVNTYELVDVRGRLVLLVFAGFAREGCQAKFNAYELVKVNFMLWYVAF